MLHLTLGLYTGPCSQFLLSVNTLCAEQGQMGTRHARETQETRKRVQDTQEHTQDGYKQEHTQDGYKTRKSTRKRYARESCRVVYWARVMANNVVQECHLDGFNSTVRKTRVKRQDFNAGFINGFLSQHDRLTRPGTERLSRINFASIRPSKPFSKERPDPRRPPSAAHGIDHRQ